MSGDGERIRRRRLTPTVAAFVALSCIAIVALSGWREWSARQFELQNAETDMANLARSLSQHAEDTFELADTVLGILVNQLELDGTGVSSVAKVQAVLDRRKQDTRIRGIFVFGEDGRWLATSEAVALAGRNSSDRTYFQHHRASADRGIFIGPPVESGAGGQLVITVSRRVDRPDGGFAGVALVTIDVDYFVRFYDKFDVGPNGAISLVSKAGIVLARSRDNSRYVGRDLSATPLLRGLDQRPTHGVYYFKSPLDGLPRLSFYQLGSRYPVMVLATESKDDLLAPWRRAALIRMSMVGALVGAIAAGGGIVVRQLRQREQLAGALAAREADFRLLAEHSVDMVMRIGFDGTIGYVSPSSTQVVGWRPDQLLGTPALAGINAEDLPRVQQLVAALRNGETDEARIVYRTRTREKGEIWMEAALGVTRNRTGRIDGVVAICRDVTEHKNAAEKLAELALSDGLTGLANRRHFDEHLQDEWSRAQREGGPVSLLLIDVDQFKKYNDHYGHQAGDECLRRVARLLAEQARRPADVAARYGGEEFAVLLPNTDAAGCARVGERVRKEVGALGIPHVLNRPAFHITVSVGGATQVPAGDIQPVVLIDAADKALYTAKKNGRDRLAMSET